MSARAGALRERQRVVLGRETPEERPQSSASKTDAAPSRASSSHLLKEQVRADSKIRRSSSPRRRPGRPAVVVAEAGVRLVINSARAVVGWPGQQVGVASAFTAGISRAVLASRRSKSCEAHELDQASPTAARAYACCLLVLRYYLKLRPCRTGTSKYCRYRTSWKSGSGGHTSQGATNSASIPSRLRTALIGMKTAIQQVHTQLAQPALLALPGPEYHMRQPRQRGAPLCKRPRLVAALAWLTWRQPAQTGRSSRSPRQCRTARGSRS